MTQTISRIVLVGRDAPVWLTALALHRALGDGIDLTVLELPTMTLEHGVYSAVPAITQLHAAIGLDELAIASACHAVPMVGQRYANWSRSAASFVHGYDATDGSDALVGLVQYWVKARGQGLQVPFGEFSLASAAGRAGKVPVPGSALGQAAPGVGYQFDARTYAAALKAVALKLGIDHRTGRLAGVKRDGDQIRSIDWEGGEEFAADLFVDASGVEALLIRLQPLNEVVSWAEWLPCDRLLNASAPPLSPLPPFSHNTAVRFGWIGLHPLQDRTAVVAAYSSKYADENDLQHLPALAGAPITGEAVVTPFAPSARPRPWVGNCVAVGTAAAELEPLDAIELHILHLGISHLTQAVDRQTDQATAAAGFNDAFLEAAESLRDFQIAHYALNRRFDEPFWDQVRSGGPPSLKAKLENFRARGSVGLLPEGVFDQSNWAAILIGHGMVPESYEPWVDQVDEEEHKELMAARLRDIGQAVQGMPTVEQYLGAQAPTPAMAF